MGLTIEMHEPDKHLLEELAYPGITQESVAITYAFCIAQLGDAADWPKLNAAIQKKWRGKTALLRVKTLAWKYVDNFNRKSQP